MIDFNENTSIVFDDNLHRMSMVQNKTCPKCGMNLIDVQRTGVVGCATCYQVFENEIKMIIVRNQGTINHIGKIPAKHFSRLKLKDRIAKLEKEKDEAILAENYIVAESIKNQIEKLKGELS